MTALGGGSVLQKGLSSSSRLRRRSTPPTRRYPTECQRRQADGTTAGWETRRLGPRRGRADRAHEREAQRHPGPRRQQTTEQFDQLDSDGKDYLGDTDIDDPTLTAPTSSRTPDPVGVARSTIWRKAIRTPPTRSADGRRCDPTPVRRAYESGEVDSDELTTALTRYDV